MRYHCQHICQECANCICSRHITNRSKSMSGHYWCDSKKGCSAGSSYFPNGIGCSDWEPWGELENLYAEFENEEIIEKQKREFEKEKTKLREENARLRQENESYRSSYSNPSSSSYSDNYDFDDLEMDDFDEEQETTETRQELESKIEEFIKSSISDLAKDSNSVIQQIKKLRKEELQDKVLTIRGLDKFVKMISDCEETMDKAKEYLNDNAKKNVAKINCLIDSFYETLKEEIDFYYNKQLYNVAFVLAKSYLSSKRNGSNDLFSKCKNEYIKSVKVIANELMQKSMFDEAIEYLDPLSDYNEIKKLLNQCYKEQDKIILNEAKKLIDEKKYELALEKLKNVTFLDTSNATKECIDKLNQEQINKAKELWNSKKRKEAIYCLDKISDSKIAVNLKNDYLKKIKKRKTITGIVVGGSAILAIVVAIIIGISVNKNNKNRIISECQSSLVGKTYNGSGKVNNYLTMSRSFVFSNDTVHVTGQSIYSSETYSIDEVFTYYCEWGPGNYGSENDYVNIYMNSTTNSTSWRYIASYDLINGRYSVTSFSYRNEPYYRLG